MIGTEKKKHCTYKDGIAHIGFVCVAGSGIA